MSGDFFKNMFAKTASNNDLIRDILREPKHLRKRVKQVALSSSAYLAYEAKVPKPTALPQRFLATLLAHDIVHAIWDDASSKRGISTRLLKGEGSCYDTLVMGRKQYEKLTEATIHVPDEDAARWIQKAFGGMAVAFESSANPAPTGTPNIAFCVDRPQSDGTMVRETIRVDMPA